MLTSRLARDLARIAILATLVAYGGCGGEALSGGEDHGTDADCASCATSDSQDRAQWPIPNEADADAGAPSSQGSTDDGDGTTTDDVNGLMWGHGVAFGGLPWSAFAGLLLKDYLLGNGFAGVDDDGRLMVCVEGMDRGLATAALDEGAPPGLTYMKH